MYTGALLQQTSNKNEESEQPMSDAELVESARAGNSEAFGELVRRHRERAIGWAFNVAQDGQLAEDIVQEALINAFLRLETLIDSSRFKYWLKRIVRNQANMKMRRGGHYGKKKPFSAFAMSHYLQGSGSDLDRLLFRLWTCPKNVGQDPQAWLLKKELISNILELLQCLSPREREIFEAYVFRQLAPTEIADLLGTSAGAVYTAISRSRTKIQRERIRVYFQGYTEEKKLAALKTRCILTQPIPF